MKISIIIPCYNEKNFIIEILKKINQINDLDYEIIIVDDASFDGSREILKQNSNLYSKLLINEKNFGKGYSVKRGIEFATNEGGNPTFSNYDYYLPNLKEFETFGVLLAIILGASLLFLLDFYDKKRTR